MNASDAARRYLCAGFAPIELPPASKNPGRLGWTDERHTLESVAQFNVESNVGVLNGAPSGGLVDIDLDAPEAVAVGALFLPVTPLVFGRPSKPRSHWLYRCDPPPTTTKYTTPRDPVTKKSEMLVELRSTGSQTVWPPSLHPSGEVVAFDGAPRKPAVVAAALLVEAVRHLAVAALLARAWPRTGGVRHEIALAAAGFLLRRAVTTDVVQTIIGAAARVAGDEETRDRVRDVLTTEHRLAHGGHATGGPRLAELLDAGVLDKFEAWFGPDTVDAGAPCTAPAPPKVEWDDVRPWPTLDGAALYGLAGDVVHILEPHTEADPAALLVTFLALFGNAIGAGPHVRVGAAQHPARLFACLVGDTARARKGQSFAEVGSLFARADPEWWEAARAGGLTSGEGIIARVRDDDQHPIEKRAHFYEPEFARTLAAAARDGSTLSPVLRDAWDSGRLAVTTRKDPLVATGAHIGVVAHVTLEELRARLTSLDIANGFANRFLFTCVRRSKKLASGGTLDEATRRELGTKVGEALRSARPRTVLSRTPTGDAAWRSVYENLPEPPGLFGAVTARADAQLLRVSLVFALLDTAERIHDAHIEAAVAVWRYAEASAAHVFGGVLGSDLADRLLEELRAIYPQGLSREAQHGLFSRNITAAALDAARTSLVRLKLAVEREEQSPGRHPWVLYALPKQTKETKEAPPAGLVHRSESLPSFSSYVPDGVGRTEGDPVDAPGSDPHRREPLYSTALGPNLVPADVLDADADSDGREVTEL